MRQILNLTTGIVFLGLSLLVVFTGYKVVTFWFSSADSNNRTVFFEVKKNQSALAVAAELESLGLVADAQYFYWFGRILGETANIKAGDYKLSTAMTPKKIMEVITSGVSFGVPITIPEGYNIKQIGSLFEQFGGRKRDFEKLCYDKKFIQELGFSRKIASLEGYLFPDTYILEKKATPKDLIRKMVSNFRNVYSKDLEDRARELGFSTHEHVTLASVIEKETGAGHERELVSSVFHNRLRKKMRLQSDPTVIYGIKNYDGNIKRHHLKEKTPYNTYVIRGLPIGPIGNPGKKSLHAALYPKESDYLYFVSMNDGTHLFTKTYEDHIKAVRKYQMNRKARQGKSWRDLHKKKKAKTN